MEFNSSRKVHIRRLVDIIMGSALNGAKTNLQKIALGRSIDISKGQAKFNETIRANTPSIYLVDPDLIAIELINSLDNPSAKQADPVALSSLIRRTLLASYPKVSLSIIEDEVSSIHNTLIEDLKQATVRNQSYVVFRRRAAAAGQELRRRLNKRKVSILVDAEAMITNIGTRVPFISYTFDASKDVNKIIQSAVVGYYKKELKSTIDVGYIGNIVNAGHVGLYSDGGFIGINMPSAFISGVANQKFTEVEQALGNIDTHIEYGLQISPKYTSKSGMFLDLTFNFTVSMPSSLNTKSLNVAEAAAIRKAAGNVVFEKLERGIKEQLTQQSILELIPEVSASPNFVEFAVNSIIATLSGRVLPKQTGKAAVKKANDIVTRNKNTLNSLNKLKISVPKGTAKLRTIKGQFTSVANLQILLNSQLQQQIKKNMVKPALQNQTGRFAESVKVERLSQSREGMVTAFYSYMKSPYQTFEPGFNQGSKTRDPKALIGKSIREIAAGLVGNRLRAVSL